MDSSRQSLKGSYPAEWRWISLARRIPGRLSDPEASSLFQLARSATPSSSPVVVEIVSRPGRSSLLLAAGLLGKFRPRLCCVAACDWQETADTWPGRDSELGARRGDARFLRTLRRCGLAHMLHIQKGSSSEVVPGWQDPIDLLFLDGGQDRQGARDDFLSWSPFLKRGGVVVFYDVCRNKQAPAQVMAEYLQPPQYGNWRQVGSLVWALKQCSEPAAPGLAATSRTHALEDDKQREIDRLSQEVLRLSQALLWNRAVLDAVAEAARRLSTGPDYLAIELERAGRNAVPLEPDEEAANASKSLRVLRERLGKAAHELAESQHAVEALRDSWSWRLTAPLRALLNAVQIPWRALRKDGRNLFRPKTILGCAQWLRFRSVVRASGLFDERFYLDYNRDVAPLGISPLLHFFVFGASQGRNPNALFDVLFYLRRNPDVAGSHVNPLLHYLKWGAQEGRDPHPYFDSSFYLEQNPDVRDSGTNPLAHYLAPGIAEGRDPNPWFDTSEYLARNPDVAASALNPLVHYLEQPVLPLRTRKPRRPAQEH